jgi:hypothetical protein
LSQRITLGVPNLSDDAVPVGDVNRVEHLKPEQHVSDVHTVSVLETHALHFLAVDQCAVGGPEVLYDHSGGTARTRIEVDPGVSATDRRVVEDEVTSFIAA